MDSMNRQLALSSGFQGSSGRRGDRYASAALQAERNLE